MCRLLSVSAMAIYYSQDARLYSLLIFLSTLLAYYWIVLIENIKSKKYSIKSNYGYIIFSILISYTNYYGFLLVICQFLWVLTALHRDKPAFNAAVKIYALSFLGYLPWINIFLIHIFDISKTAHWIPNAIYHPFFELLLWYFNFQKV